MAINVEELQRTVPESTDSNFSDSQTEPSYEGSFRLPSKGPRGLVLMEGKAKVDETGSINMRLLARKEDLDNNVPVMTFEPGFFGSQASYALLLEELALQGQPTVMGDRQSLFFHRDHPGEQIKHPERLQIVSGLAIARVTTQELETKQSRGAGHSMGGVAIARMAQLDPKLFESVLLLGSGGITGHNVVSLGSGLYNYARTDLRPTIPRMQLRFSLDLLRQQFKYLVNPRTPLEAIAVAQANILQALVEVGRSGVKAASINFAMDGFFPASVAARNSAHLVEFRDHPDKSATHEYTHTNPRELAAYMIDLNDHLLHDTSDFMYLKAVESVPQVA